MNTAVYPLIINIKCSVYDSGFVSSPILRVQDDRNGKIQAAFVFAGIGRHVSKRRFCYVFRVFPLCSPLHLLLLLFLLLFCHFSCESKKHPPSAF